MTQPLPCYEHLRNLVWKYSNFFELLANEIIEGSYQTKKHDDKRATAIAVMIVVVTTVTTMAGALNTTFQDFFAASALGIGFIFSVLIILLAATSAILSFFNRQYIERTARTNKTIEELNRHRNDLILWKRELVELQPAKYRKELDYMDEKLMRLSQSVNATINRTAVNLPPSLDLSTIDINNPRQNDILNQYKEFVKSICDRHGFRYLEDN